MAVILRIPRKLRGIPHGFWQLIFKEISYIKLKEIPFFRGGGSQNLAVILRILRKLWDPLGFWQLIFRRFLI